MIDISVVANVAGLAAEKIKSYGEATFQFTKSSFNQGIGNFDKEKIQEYASKFVVSCRNNLAEVRCTTRFYLRPNNLDMLLKKICDQIISQDYIEFKVVYVSNKFLYKTQVHTCMLNSCLNFNSNCRAQNECFNNLLAKIIWYEFDHQLAQKYLPKQDPTMQNWNKRVNEKELVKKLGSPTYWNIFFDGHSTDAIENVRDENAYEEKILESMEPQKVKENVMQTTYIDHVQKTEKLKRLAMINNNSLLANDLRQPLLNPECIKQKKRSGVMNSIKKIFKSDKPSVISKPNKSQQEGCLEKCAKGADNHNNDAKKEKHSNMFKDESISLEESTDIGRSRGKEYQSTFVNTMEPDDADNNSLMIHIPTNVQKIVLVKDGHKIKLEL